jgi:hypothetical protein
MPGWHRIAVSIGYARPSGANPSGIEIYELHFGSVPSSAARISGQLPGCLWLNQ